jgi:preprotein translocase subunit YajC
MFISPAYAQDAAGGSASSLGMLYSAAPLVAIFIVFYFILIRPQQKRQKETQSMIAALKRGDRVVTGGGIIGVVQSVPPDKDGKPVNEITVEIAAGVRVTVLRDSVTHVIRPQAANDAKPPAKAG